MKTRTHIFTIISVLVIGSFCLFAFQPANAQSLKDNVTGQLNAGGSKAGFSVQNTKTPQQIAAEVIKIILSITGILFTALIVYAGYNLMTAAGEEDKISTGRKTIAGAIIGLTITLSAYAITDFVARRAYNVTTGTNTYKVNNSSFDANEGKNVSDFFK